MNYNISCEFDGENEKYIFPSEHSCNGIVLKGLFNIKLNANYDGHGYFNMKDANNVVNFNVTIRFKTINSDTAIAVEGINGWEDQMAYAEETCNANNVYVKIRQGTGTFAFENKYSTNDMNGTYLADIDLTGGRIKFARNEKIEIFVYTEDGSIAERKTITSLRRLFLPVSIMFQNLSVLMMMEEILLQPIQ